MILNPPAIVILLRRWQVISSRPDSPFAPAERSIALAKNLRLLTGHQTYDAFLRTYQLYLQSIPFETAKAAWGLNAALASAHTHHQK